MNIVTWISNNQIDLIIKDVTVIDQIKGKAIKLCELPRAGHRQSQNHFYIHYESQTLYSNGPYQFPDNPILENLCMILNELNFVFWGTFKTEIAPQHFMESLQKRKKLPMNFKYIEAGDNQVKNSMYTNA